MQTRIAIGLAGLILCGGIALADPPPAGDTATAPVAGAAATTDAATRSPAETLICFRAPPPTGSHMGDGKECHTRTEWEQLRTATGDAARRVLNNVTAEQQRTTLGK